MATRKDLLKYKSLMVKSNYIIESSYKLNLQEQRLIYILTTKINKNDKEFKPYKFTQSEVNNILLKHRISYNELSQHIDNLRNKELIIVKEESILKTKWLSSAEYFKNGSVELCFDDKLKPYLLQLKERFTKTSMDIIITFNSNYSCRIYELLKQYENLGKRCLSIEVLRTMFCIEPGEYSRYNDFKRKVILQAQKEINANTDISFEFEEIKTGRKVTSINFIIKTSKPTKNSQDETCATIEDKPTIKAEQYATDLLKGVQAIFTENITAQDAKKLLVTSKGDVNVIKQKYVLSKNAHKIDNLMGWILKAIKDDYKTLKGNTKVSKFNNFEQRTYDYEDLESKLTAWNK